jgi:uncharacterized protein
MFSLTDDQKRYLLETARETIEAELEHREPRYPEQPGPEEPCGVFVTLHIDGSLRGCIGRMTSPEPLSLTIREIARSSAFGDPRFPPLSTAEADRFDIEISVLTPMVPVHATDEIQVGTHGILIRKNGRSGVLLPQVATEQGWDRDTFLKHTCMKAGLHGDCWKDAGTEILIFSAIVFGEKNL